AAQRQNAALQTELAAKLQEVEGRVAAKDAEELETYRQSHNTASLQTLQSAAEARVQAQKHQNKQHMMKSNLIQMRLQAEVHDTAAVAESSMSGSAADMRALSKSITKAKALEAVKLSKASRQTAEMMKTAKSLEASYEAESRTVDGDAKVDQLMSKEAA
ncbi:unnamed protein product, partial [Symbiodinium pilosum]